VPPPRSYGQGAAPNCECEPSHKRRRCLHPVVRERQSLVNQLQAILRDLGLERKAQAVPTLDEYLRGRHPPDPAA